MVISGFALSLIGPAQVCVCRRDGSNLGIYRGRASFTVYPILFYLTLIRRGLVCFYPPKYFFDMSLVGKVAGRVVVVVKVREPT